MKKLLLFKKAHSHERLSQKIQAELTKQLELVGSLSETCQKITLTQLTECLPLLLAFRPRKVRGWQDSEHHGASLSLSFGGNYQLVITIFCPPNDAQPWYPDAKIFVYKGSQLATYLACHHSYLCAALHRSLQVLSQEQAKQAH
ncbi:hypothetical protein [Hymenobacter metallicola]|uniref:Uncharacterized protein n=1 Tax=Hymenobacter metallicola TaxID=2563114 RepID=A0A4Z0QFK2_9BACT|nr:hypothetical protein [Hymenobacter metallicola]TGE28534.1 hypothetical protein E5K02_03445 [Hymenobacter metallicola]